MTDSESVQIFCMNSDVLLLESGSVHLTVTSPPYRNAIDYAKHLSGGYFRGREKVIPLSKYIENMKKHFLEVWRVSKEGAYCCIVIGNEIIPKKNQIVSLPSHFVMLMGEIGWVFQEEVIWYKVTGGKKRFRVTVQHPYPTYYYPNILHEKILIFRRGKVMHRRVGVDIMQERIDVLKNSKVISLEIAELLKREIANSVWHIPPVPSNPNHPCPFPENLAYRLIFLYSCPGDLVLDPFCGIGTTVKVAAHLKRRAIGYDIVKRYCEVAEQRLREPLKLRDPLLAEWVYLSDFLREKSNKPV